MTLDIAVTSEQTDLNRFLFAVRRPDDYGLPNYAPAYQSPLIQLNTQINSTDNFAENEIYYEKSFGLRYVQRNDLPIRSIESDFNFENRIKALIELTKSEDYSLNSDSRRAFWEFVKKSQNLHYDCLFLLENGNLHATWDDEQSNHIGLEFVDKQTIGFVIFKWRESYESVSRLSGYDTIDGVGKLIATYELENLLFGS